jgi:acetyl coenzyme A synthetase (ADP forming)-like protein
MLDSLLRPRSIAVIGASRRPGSIGNAMLRHLVQSEFTGPVYPFPSVRDLPTVPELAIIVVPKEHVLAVVRECVETGVRGLVVITAGFREVGGDGIDLEADLLALVRENGLRMVGPNCMGVMNTSSAVSMNATFAPAMPPNGPIAFMSQSGAMGMTILDYAMEYGIGISQFVSMGNKADVSGNDLIEYWQDDDEVGVILMYIEGFGNPRHFTTLARRATRRKPVLAVKAGRSEAGAKAASSHTGALAEVDIATDALFAQCGVLRADTVEALFDAAIAFSKAPLPDGPRVAILTNAGGPGIIIADACEGFGLEVAVLTEDTQRSLREHLPAEASVANPVDMIASATPEQVEQALRIVVTDPGIDAVIASYVPLGLEAPVIAAAIKRGAEDSDKPVLAVLMSKRGLPQGMAELQESTIPAYRFPESAARALGAMWRYRRWLERPVAEVRRFDVDAHRVEEILSTATQDGRDRLSIAEAFEVLRCYGVPIAPFGIGASEEEVVAAADELGYPIVLKAVSQDIVHKTEAGAVKLDVRDEEALRVAWRDVSSALEREGPAAREAGVLVQRMWTGGRETIVGMTMEPRFGPILMFGLGGVYVEVQRDVTFRVQPVSTVDAQEMIRSLRGYPILEGVRGQEGVDLDQLAEVIERVNQLVGEHPQIREMDINPFLAFPVGQASVAVDARFRLGRGDPSEGRPW